MLRGSKSLTRQTENWFRIPKQESVQRVEVGNMPIITLGILIMNE